MCVDRMELFAVLWTKQTEWKLLNTRLNKKFQTIWLGMQGTSGHCVLMPNPFLCELLLIVINIIAHFFSACFGDVCLVFHWC